MALLKAAYTSIKAADPDAIVVTGAPTPAGDVNLGQGLLAIDDVQYFRKMYEAGMKGYFDAVGVHASGFNNPPDTYQDSAAGPDFKGHRSFYFRNFENYYRIMEEHGDGDKKLWLTEFGWASAQGTPPPANEYAYARQNSEEEQAKWLVNAFKIAQERGYVRAMFIWNLNFAPGADAGDVIAKRAFSILRSDWGPRPAYKSLVTMSK
ncbi:MAG: hypothetical protein HW403_115 [Dehalococcoidia bacterium]|nr:hypothetical protein [Dehalococcoidia bacterium]